MNKKLYYYYMPKNHNFICYLCNNKIFVNVDYDIEMSFIDAECKNPLCFNCEKIYKKILSI